MLQGIKRLIAHAVGEHSCGRRRGLRQPLVIEPLRLTRHDVKQDREQVARGDTVDHAVMQLAQQAPAIVSEPLDQPHLPQRSRAVQQAAHHPSNRSAQPGVRAGPRQRGVTQVIIQLKARVCDPQRAAKVERHQPHPLAITRQGRQLHAQ
jgi:hypothetical protein